MIIRNTTKRDKGTLERYIFYRGLGYSVTVAEILSCVTYGSPELAFRIGEFGEGNALEQLHAWLEEQKEASPDAALRAYYDGKHRSPEVDFMRFRAMPSPSGAAELRATGMPLHCRERKRSLNFEKPRKSIAQAEAELECLASYSICSPRSEKAERATPVCRMEIDSGEGGFLSFAEMLATDAFETIEEKAAKGVFTAPTSTFRMTTSTASMGVLFNQLRAGRHIDMDQVRIEEILNYFDYETEKPAEEKFAVSTELLPKSEDRKLLYIHVQAREEVREHQNVIVLLDVSGSMTGNAEVTQATVAAILSKLQPGDRFSLVTYSSEDRTVVDGYRIESEQDKERLMGILLGIEITGGTWGSAGIERAYELGARYRQDGWSNQVMLITDGDLNFGITSKGGLKDLIEEKKKSGLFLSVIGTGLWNYKDDKLEVLSKHGNGTYCVVNSLEDVTESVDRRYIALTNIIAKDVKAQVEFNPRLVRTYRLLGYENRELNHEDFADDTVISEPYGSDGHGVALYELEMGEAAPSGLKYQTAVPTGSDELCTVKVRYKEPLADVSHEIETAVPDRDCGTKNAELAWLLYCVSEKLRGSDRLDAADEEFLERMLSGGKYKELARGNEKLTLFVEAMLLNRR